MTLNRSRLSRANIIRTTALALGLTVTAAACGLQNGGEDAAPDAATNTAPVQTTTPAEVSLTDEEGAEAPASEADEASDSAPELAAGEIDGRTVLADADGYSLYAFLNDEANTSSCSSPCSDTWPPVATDEVVAIDPLQLTSAARPDGSRQLAVNGWPLYRYLGDENPGEVNGQQVGDVWFAVDVDGNVIIPSGAKIGSTDGGDVLIEANGFTVYRFAKDVKEVSNCNGACADNWPPVPGSTLLDGSVVNIDEFGTRAREDGSLQLTWNGWPLYTFSGDQFPGDANGRGLGDGAWTTVDASSLGEGLPAEKAPRAIADGPAPEVVAAEESGEAQYANSVGAAATSGGGAYGSSIPDAPAAPDVPEAAEVDAVTTANSDFGQIIVDTDGFTLYAFTNDEDGVSNCNGSCADAWPGKRPRFGRGVVCGCSNRVPDQVGQL